MAWTWRSSRSEFASPSGPSPSYVALSKWLPLREPLSNGGWARTPAGPEACHVRLVQSLGPLQSVGLLLGHPRPRHLDSVTPSPGLPDTPCRCGGNQLGLSLLPLESISQSSMLKEQLMIMVAPSTDVVLIP